GVPALAIIEYTYPPASTTVELAPIEDSIEYELSRSRTRPRSHRFAANGPVLVNSGMWVRTDSFWSIWLGTCSSGKPAIGNVVPAGKVTPPSPVETPPRNWTIFQSSPSSNTST